MKKKRPVKNPTAKAVRTPKYRMRVVADKKKKKAKNCKIELEESPDS